MDITVNKDTTASKHINAMPISMYVDIEQIQKYYLPGVSKRRIRAFTTSRFKTLRNGKRILVDRKQLEEYLSDPDIEKIM